MYVVYQAEHLAWEFCYIIRLARVLNAWNIGYINSPPDKSCVLILISVFNTSRPLPSMEIIASLDVLK